MTRIRIYQAFLVVCIALSLAACSSAAASPTATLPQAPATALPASDTPAPTPTPTLELPTATATTEPTATLSPTVTLTPTITPSPTLSPTPTVVMIQPGFYATGGCAVSHPGGSGSSAIDYEFCVLSVEVTRDQHMIFNVSWKVTKLDQGKTYAKASEQGNDDIYLVDNLGNVYHHLSGGGAAYDGRLLQNNQQVTGWLEFQKVKQGAVNFSFYDETHDIVIKGIPMLFPTVIFEALALRNFPLQLEYSTLKWAVGTLPDGSPGLLHQKIEGCIIQEKPSGQPQGTLYNLSQVIGDATYAIYGAIDQASNTAFREYVLLGGAELVQAGQPLFRVTIPLDNSTVCVYDASDVLGKLSLRP
jgi:hypothetical protein